MVTLEVSPSRSPARPGGAGAGTQYGVLDVDARTLVQERARVIERDPAVVERLTCTSR